MGWGIFGSISHDISHAVTDTVKAVTHYTAPVVKDISKKIVKPADKYINDANNDVNNALGKLSTDVSTDAKKSGIILEHSAKGFANVEVTTFKDFAKKSYGFGTVVKKDLSGDLHTAEKDIKSAGKKVYDAGVANLILAKDELDSTGTIIEHDADGVGSDIEHGAEDAGHDIYKAGTDVYGGLKDIGDWFSKYWEIIVAVIVGVILLIVFVFAKGGGKIA